MDDAGGWRSRETARKAGNDTAACPHSRPHYTLTVSLSFRWLIEKGGTGNNRTDTDTHSEMKSRMTVGRRWAKSATVSCHTLCTVCFSAHRQPIISSSPQEATVKNSFLAPGSIGVAWWKLFRGVEKKASFNEYHPDPGPDVDMGLCVVVCYFFLFYHCSTEPNTVHRPGLWWQTMRTDKEIGTETGVMISLQGDGRWFHPATEGSVETEKRKKKMK